MLEIHAYGLKGKRLTMAINRVRVLSFLFALIAFTSTQGQNSNASFATMLNINRFFYDLPAHTQRDDMFNHFKKVPFTAIVPLNFIDELTIDNLTNHPIIKLPDDEDAVRLSVMYYSKGEKQGQSRFKTLSVSYPLYKATTAEQVYSQAVNYLKSLNGMKFAGGKSNADCDAVIFYYTPDGYGAVGVRLHEYNGNECRLSIELVEDKTDLDLVKEEFE